MSRSLHVAIVGATGAVGEELLGVLERRNFPVKELTLLASARSVGKTRRFRGQAVAVLELIPESFCGVDLALFSAGANISREFAPRAVSYGALVVDNSSAFRMRDAVPLVVPEINAADAYRHHGIVANPNCTTAIALMALAPLHAAFGLRRVVAASYQAVSGTGAQAMVELARQERQMVEGQAITSAVYPCQIVRNVLPRIGNVLPSGYTDEEDKLEREGRKILHLPDLRVSTTCVRVPVMRAHSVAINAEFAKPVSVEEALTVLSRAPGLELLNDTEHHAYPMPLFQAGKDACAVGRVRQDAALDNGLAFWVVGDQLLKGAALNAVQIAELFL